MPYITIDIEGATHGDRFFVAGDLDEVAFTASCRAGARAWSSGAEVLDRDPQAPKCPDCHLDLSEFATNGEILRYCPGCSRRLADDFPCSCSKCGRVFLGELPGRAFCPGCSTRLTFKRTRICRLQKPQKSPASSRSKQQCGHRKIKSAPHKVQAVRP